MTMRSTPWLAVGILGAAAALAADAKPGSTNPSPWAITLSAGGVFTDGNSETFKGNASLLVEGEKAPLGSVRAGAEVNYGESKVDGDKRTDTDNGKVFVNAKKTLSPMTFAYGDAAALRDDLAKLDYRVVLGPGVGLYAIKNARTSLSVEAGPSYLWEKKDHVSSEYWALRAAERFEFKISDTARCWQSAEVLGRVDDFDDYLLNAEVGVEAALNSYFNLRLVLQDKYDNQPGEGLKSNDISLIAGVSLKL